ncbi:MAG: protein kinase [bacterium]
MEVRAVGEPFDDGTLARWVAAGILGTPAAERLKLLAEMDAMAPEAIEAVLSAGPEIDGSSEWDWESQHDSRSLLGRHRPARPEVSWSDEETLYDTGIVEPEQGPALAGRARFDLSDRPIMRGRFVETHLARDLLLGRDVAVHVAAARSPLDAEGFVDATRRQAALQHPAVQPIYELAELAGPDGEPLPFFATSLPLPDTLDGAIKGRARGGQGGRALWRAQTLLEALLDVARAIAFAHRNGTVHRDLRPIHVLLGPFGEVLLAGWFRARHWSTPTSRERDARLNEVGSGLGYLAPERLLHGLSHADARADVWGLGALLYAILADRPPFAGPSSTDVIARIKEGHLSPPGQHQSGVPLALEDLCLRALVIEPEARRLSADEFVADLENYLDGNRADERRAERARALLVEAGGASARFRQHRRALQALRAPGQPRPALATLDAARQAMEDALHQADEAFVRAQAALPGHRGALAGQADLYARALQDAELDGDSPAAFLAGTLDQLELGLPSGPLPALAHLEVRTEPAGAEVTLHQYDEQSGVLRPDAGRRLGFSPVALADARPGRYLLRLTLPDRPTVLLPVQLDRGEAQHLDVSMPRTWPADTALISAGTSRLGAADDALFLGGALPPCCVTTGPSSWGARRSRSPSTPGSSTRSGPHPPSRPRPARPAPSPAPPPSGAPRLRATPSRSPPPTARSGTASSRWSASSPPPPRPTRPGAPPGTEWPGACPTSWSGSAPPAATAGCSRGATTPRCRPATSCAAAAPSRRPPSARPPTIARPTTCSTSRAPCAS